MLGGVASMLSVVQDELIKDVELFSEVGRAKFMNTVNYRTSGATRFVPGLRINNTDKKYSE